jgi:hypothetical protein
MRLSLLHADREIERDPNKLRRILEEQREGIERQ